ncbi:hypothetical protein KL86DYS1_30789 [uncultured Dysgonomonas sp.]|uniref:Uncharacterized protein n=1 Tax=uncultured Dysgonomonas sp. TaxID=206096 RepID=A0A212JXZ1_9BACT|nr:hypothetical protein KL86DYS1_30789 [uncultured Dysgonomonas sp.]
MWRQSPYLPLNLILFVLNAKNGIRNDQNIWLYVDNKGLGVLQADVDVF